MKEKKTKNDLGDRLDEARDRIEILENRLQVQLKLGLLENRLAFLEKQIEPDDNAKKEILDMTFVDGAELIGIPPWIKKRVEKTPLGRLTIRKIVNIPEDKLLNYKSVGTTTVGFIVLALRIAGLKK